MHSAVTGSLCCSIDCPSSSSRPLKIRIVLSTPAVTNTLRYGKEKHERMVVTKMLNVAVERDLDVGCEKETLPCAGFCAS